MDTLCRSTCLRDAMADHPRMACCRESRSGTGVRSYVLGENLDVRISLAARVAQKPRGASRRIALGMKHDLFPVSNSESEDDGAGGRRKKPNRSHEAANRLGIQRLLERLKDLQPGRQDVKGEKLMILFGTTKLYRRRGPRMAEF